MGKRIIKSKKRERSTEGKSSSKKCKVDPHSKSSASRRPRYTEDDSSSESEASTYIPKEGAWCRIPKKGTSCNGSDCDFRPKCPKCKCPTRSESFEEYKTPKETPQPEECNTPNETPQPDVKKPKVDSESSRLRATGNNFFGKYKAATNVLDRRISLHSALEWYRKAVAASNGDDDRASALKNMAICFGILADLELAIVTRIHYCKEAAINFADAGFHGERAAKPESWLDSVMENLIQNVDKFIEAQKDASEDNVLNEILGVIDRDLQYIGYQEFMAMKRLHQGETVMNLAIELIAEKNYKKGLPKLHDVYRPLELATKHSKYVVGMMKDIRVVQKEFITFLAIGEGLQSFEQGVKALDDALECVEDDHNKAMRLGLQSLDHFKEAEVLARGEEVELIAMVQSKIGIANQEIFKLKQKAKTCFVEAMNLSTTLVGNLYNHSWYIELTARLQAIRDEEQRIEDEKWENKRKPFIAQLEKELRLLNAKQTSTPRNLVDFLFTRFPPKHIKNAKKPIIEEGADAQDVKKAMVKVCALYHPDKVDKEKFDTKYVVLCEEITKVVTMKYTDMKMAY